MWCIPPQQNAEFVARMEALGLQMGIGLAVMLVAILIVGKLRKINFGSVPLAMLKLCAVMVGPEVVMVFIRPVLGLIPIVGGLGNAIVGFSLSFALLGTFFDLDQSDTWHLICVTILIYLIGLFLSMWLAPGLI